MFRIPFTAESSEATKNPYLVLPALQVILGALYLTMLTQVRIPLQPVPVTMQTFAIFTLALFYGSRKAAFSVALFLGAATIGFPVFGSFSSNPMWILSPTAGYLMGFPITAYIIGKLVEKQTNPSFFRLTLSVIIGQAVLYLLGVSWLSFFVGFEKAIQLGLLPFIPIGILKILAAVSLKMATKRWI